ncbi:cobyric acid synthase [Paenibacillus methanolicus]|uniref:Cobyric acid synthase n=1 Tax=Paenibacillus methanolicus TaxID=582686 RepID=A0A5S5CDX2_9BACL|nr:cobyric acid synthase [Paenibacillus methanolicus]TYP77554.1 adenosylcobyric acid synthase [Paenibacillus methanolicus]
MKKPARTVMIQGTASDAGKSVINTAICRILSEDGYKVAPFKSQNMSLNSYVTWDGKEIGRAQGVQADACGILATTDMNPILLKPKKDMVSQVVVHGKPMGDYAARTYREQILREAEPIVRGALDRLRSEYDVVVLEGAGSPAEINLKDRDIVNMRAAGWADAPVVLVADIDRGGMFAAIVGTMELLEPHERERVCGFIVNKFRGDVSLLEPGLDWLEARTGKPVLGVVPYLPDLGIEDEDSLSLDGKMAAAKASEKRERANGGELAVAGVGDRADGAGGRLAGVPGDLLDVAVIRLPHISNFTDIDPLLQEPDVRVRFVRDAREWGEPDIVIIPGSKNAVDDLAYLRESGLATLLERHREAGRDVVGICGGYEMLGLRLLDPLHAESDRDETDGLGWFPFEVTFAAEKRTVRVEGMAILPGLTETYPVEGYEIHMGAVNWPEAAAADASIAISHQREGLANAEAIDGESDGGVIGLGADENGSQVRPFRLRERLDSAPFAEGCASADGRVWGTFLHGVLHNDAFRRAWLNRVRESRGLKPVADIVPTRQRREEAFGRLAEHVRRHVRVDLLKQMMGLGDETR